MNWVAIVIAAIAQFIIGWVWYGPLFGKTWMSMMGMSQQSMSTGAARHTAPMRVPCVALLTCPDSESTRTRLPMMSTGSATMTYGM